MKKITFEQMLERLGQDTGACIIPYITFKVKRTLFPQKGEPSEMIEEIIGDIFIESNDHTVKIGRLRGSILRNTSDIYQEEDIYEMADAESAELEECAAAFYKDGEPNKKVLKMFGEGPWCSDLLFLMNVDIEPAYRGQKFGLAAVLRFLDTFREGCGFVICKPFPVQYTGKVNEENKANFLADQAKLITYWKKLGFKKMPGSDFMVICLELRGTPTFEDLNLKQPDSILYNGVHYPIFIE